MPRILLRVLPAVTLLIGITLTGVAGAATLSASPASVVQGGSVTATWSGIVAPTVDNWIGTYKPGTSDGAYFTRQWTGGGASGSAAVSIPIGLATGTYELRIFVRDSFTLLATSNTFTVTVAPPALTVTPATVNAGANVTASWVRMPAPSTGDWIALAIPGTPNTEFISFRNASGTAAGSMYFPIPAEIYTRTYELRYFASGTNTLRATSNVLTISGTTPTSLSASPGSAAPGASLTVNWAAIATPRSGDWIAFTPTGSPNDVWQARFDTNGAASGSTSFTIPAGTGNGTFELRLFASGTTTRLATSNTITVAGAGPTISASPGNVVPGGAVTATWSGIYTPKVSDWVGLYAAGAPDISPLTQVFTQGTAPSGTGSVPVTADISPGTYELRLFDSAGSRLATSSGFTVEAATSTTIFYIQSDHLNTPRLIANQTPATVWKWDNEDPFGGNGANANPSGLGTFTFNLRLPGQYFDSETNNHYNFYRDYSPEIGRYIESDPIGVGGGLNTYQYANGRPIILVDPLGLKSRVCCRRIPWIGGLGIRHCYIQSVMGGGGSAPITYGLIGGRFSGQQSGTGNIYKQNNFDRGGDCGDWIDNCEVDKCVQSAANSYPNPSAYRYTGDNSNTFAGIIAKACGLPRPILPPNESTPGWGRDAASQLPGTTYQSPTDLSE